jgi:outer membrane protein assembly factor BamA
VALPFALKSILRQKKFIETQIFDHAKMQSSKNPLKETKKPPRYYNSITNIKFQHKPKYVLSNHLDQSL